MFARTFARPDSLAQSVIPAQTRAQSIVPAGGASARHALAGAQRSAPGHPQPPLDSRRARLPGSSPARAGGLAGPRRARPRPARPLPAGGSGAARRRPPPGPRARRPSAAARARRAAARSSWRASCARGSRAAPARRRSRRAPARGRARRLADRPRRAGEAPRRRPPMFSSDTAACSDHVGAGDAAQLRFVGRAQLLLARLAPGPPRRPRRCDALLIARPAAESGAARVLIPPPPAE